MNGRSVDPIYKMMDINDVQVCVPQRRQALPPRLRGLKSCFMAPGEIRGDSWPTRYSSGGLSLTFYQGEDGSTSLFPFWVLSLKDLWCIINKTNPLFIRNVNFPNSHRTPLLELLLGSFSLLGDQNRLGDGTDYDPPLLIVTAAVQAWPFWICWMVPYCCWFWRW